MIVTFLIWLNIFIHSLIWGDFFNASLNKLTKQNKIKNSDDESFFLTLFIGLVFIALFAQLFHFFHRFDIYAQVVLTLVSVVFLFFRFKNIKNRFTTIYQKLKKQNVLFLLGAALLSFSLLILSSDSPSFYDTDLYHAQTVKWAENYPVVIGLGNLYSAFALNSSVFTLYALFSFHFVSGQSLHAVSGFVIVLFVLYCYWLSFSQPKLTKSLSVSHIFTILLLLFFIFCPLFSELAASLAPDIIANIFGFLTFMLVIRTKEKKQITNAQLFKILLFAIFAVSAKLSMVCMLLVPLLYWHFYLKSWRNVFITLSILSIILGPYLVKSALLSGYLLYPFYWFDVLQVDWKMSYQAIYEEMMWIRSWNRIPGESFSEVMKRSLFEWVPVWYHTLKPTNKVFITLFAIIIFFTSIRSIFVPKKELLTMLKPYFNLYMVLIFGTLVWFFGSPDPRFGYAFFISLGILLLTHFGYKLFVSIWQLVLQKLPLLYLRKFYFFIYLLIITPFLLRQVLQDKFFTVFKDHLLTPRDYIEYKMLPETRNGLTFYYTAKEDRMGYAAPLPSTPFSQNQFSLRGNDISQGFRYGL